MRLAHGRFISATGLCLLLASCAQTGPPLPPSLELPKSPTDLRASRKGDRVTLTWSEPTLTTDRQSVRYLGPTLICRSQQTEITVCGTPAATIASPSTVQQKPSARHRAARTEGSAPPPPETYVDILPANMQTPDPAAEVTYAVEVLNRNARGPGLSNRVHVPAIVTLPAPRDLSVKLTGDGIVLSWTSAGGSQKVPASPGNSDSKLPTLQLRYRIYRHEESTGDQSSGKDVIAGELPLGDQGPIHFTDMGFEWEKTYRYWITGVSIIQRAHGEVQVEGDDSVPLRVVAHDVFPPSVPTGLQAAYSGEGQKPFIDLIWAPVTNADLAGYNVFRSETNSSISEKSGLEKMVKLNSELVKSPAYRDFAVTAGKTYIYSVSAVDVRGNESQRSEEASEPVP